MNSFDSNLKSLTRECFGSNSMSTAQELFFLKLKVPNTGIFLAQTQSSQHRNYSQNLMYTSHNIGRHGIWKSWYCSLAPQKFCWHLVNTCWPKMYLQQNKRIWCFNLDMCVFEGNWLVNKCEYFFRGGSGRSAMYIFSMISIFCSRYDMSLIESTLESQWSVLSHPDKIFSCFDPYL